MPHCGFAYEDVTSTAALAIHGINLYHGLLFKLCTVSRVIEVAAETERRR